MKEMKNTTFLYLSEELPSPEQLHQWIALPLCLPGQLPIDHDGKTSLLMANVADLRSLLENFDKMMKKESEENEKEKYLEKEVPPIDLPLEKTQPEPSTNEPPAAAPIVEQPTMSFTRSDIEDIARQVFERSLPAVQQKFVEWAASIPRSAAASNSMDTPLPDQPMPSDAAQATNQPVAEARIAPQPGQMARAMGPEPNAVEEETLPHDVQGPEQQVQDVANPAVEDQPGHAANQPVAQAPIAPQPGQNLIFNIGYVPHLHVGTGPHRLQMATGGSNKNMEQVLGPADAAPMLHRAASHVQEGLVGTDRDILETKEDEALQLAHVIRSAGEYKQIGQIGITTTDDNTNCEDLRARLRNGNSVRCYRGLPAINQLRVNCLVLLQSLHRPLRCNYINRVLANCCRAIPVGGLLVIRQNMSKLHKTDVMSLTNRFHDFRTDDNKMGLHIFDIGRIQDRDHYWIMKKIEMAKEMEVMEKAAASPPLDAGQTGDLVAADSSKDKKEHEEKKKKEHDE